MNEIQAFQSYISFLKELLAMNEQSFFTPIHEGKWSTAAIVSHILFWDRFLLTNQLSHIHDGAKLPSFNQNIQEKNEKARSYAHSGIRKEELIQEAIRERENVIEVVKKLALHTRFSIGDNPFLLSDYIKQEVEHDLHHMKQIQQFQQSFV